MSHKDASDASSGKDSEYKEPEYDSGGNLLKGDKDDPHISSNEEEQDDRDNKISSQSTYMRLHAEWISCNQKRLVALGLIRKEGESKNKGAQLQSVPNKQSAIHLEQLPAPLVVLELVLHQQGIIPDFRN